MGGIRQIEIVFLLLLLFIIIFGLLARKLGTPYPIVMVIGGLILGFIPGVLDIELEPDLIFLVILPPLLYAAAWSTSWRDFRYNLVSIFLLAFGLVAFTVAAVAFLAPRVFPGFDWRLGFVLGAVVAPTDAIAATSIARRLSLPARIVDILEGESLINDATGLLALQFATAIVVKEETPTVSSGIVTLAWLVAGGVVLGLMVGWVIYYIERRINDGPIEIALSILTPYGAYLVAEQLHASGVLAVVTCGLFLSRRSATFFTPSVRIQAWAVWESLNFVLNGLVFVMIGLQLPFIRASIREYSLAGVLWSGVIFSLLLIVLRLVWVYPGARFAWLVQTRLLHRRDGPPGKRHVFVLGWTGMRGVVSLAAALSLPVVLKDGQPFPHRNFIVFLVFCVICFTLVLQGLTLPSVIRALKLGGPAGPNCEEREARQIILQTAVEYLEETRAGYGPDAAPLFEDLTRHYYQRLASLGATEANGERFTDHDRHVEVSLKALRVERDTVIKLRDEGRINDEVLRRIERELDLEESRIAESGRVH